MVYNLYLLNDFISKNCEILNHLNQLPTFDNNFSTDEKLHSIEKVYKSLSDPAHPVSIAMEKMKTIPEVRIIEGLDK